MGNSGACRQQPRALRWANHRPGLGPRPAGSPDNLRSTRPPQHHERRHPGSDTGGHMDAR
eukprot:11754411-Heterocapsa_arctica.AAC.1